MNCIWYETGNGNEKRCRREGCENRVLTDYPPERCHAICQVAIGSCASRGEYLRDDQCPTCSGSVRIKVFQCDRHSECTIGQPMEGIACCVQCTDFKATI